MATETDYNGWKNRTTWNIMLWLDNDEPTYRTYRAEVAKLKAAGKRVSGLAARRIARDAMGDTTPDGCKLTAKCVDWKAIAEAMAEE